MTRRQMRPGRGRIARATIVAAVVGLGCESAPRTPDAPSAPARFTASTFGLEEEALHRPIVSIENEAREVIVAPPVIDLPEVSFSTDSAGGAVVPLDLDEHLGFEPAAAFRVRVSRRGRDLDSDEGTAEIEALDLVVGTEMADGWQLVREGPGEGPRLEFAPGSLEAQADYALRVELVGTTPTDVSTAPLSFGDGARLQIAFGVDRVPHGRDVIEARFRGALECEASGGAVLVDEPVRLAVGETPAWRSRELPLPERVGACTLRLSIDGPEGVGRVAFWGVPRLARATPEEKTNLVLISLDTLRADHLSGYGYDRETSPNIDRELIARGTTFEAASSPYPLTLPAHLSLFTGLYPGAVRYFEVTDEMPVTLLAESLRDEGLATAAFTEGGLMSAHFGLARGFERFVEFPFSRDDRGAPIFAAGAEFLREHADRPFFLFLHTYKTHAPYVSGPEYRDLFSDAGERVGGPYASEVMPVFRADVDAYDRTIREVDAQLAEFLAELERLDLADRTWVVLTSDHGEGFGEHGHARHGMDGHQEQVHVPLVFRGPGIESGHRVKEPVGLIDVTPTILGLYGLLPPKELDGQSVAGALRGASLEAYRPLLSRWLGGGNQRAVRIGDLKLVQRGRSLSLYDLASDPRETTNAGARHGVATGALRREGRRLSREVAARQSRLSPPDSPTRPKSVGPELEESLKALGYVD